MKTMNCWSFPLRTLLMAPLGLFYWRAGRGCPPVERRMKPEDLDALLADLAEIAYVVGAIGAAVWTWLP